MSAPPSRPLPHAARQIYGLQGRILTVAPEPLLGDRPTRLPKRSDWLLVLGIVLSPITGVALGPLNLGELLVLLWCALEWLFGEPRPLIPLRDGLWWYLFYLSIVMGTWIGAQVSPQSTTPIGLLTWVYFAIAYLTILSSLITSSRQHLERLLCAVGSVGIVFYGLLLILSVTALQTLFGVNLWYAESRFSGGGANPHYVALLTLACWFIIFRALMKAHRLWMRLWYLVLLVIGAEIAVATASTTLLVAAGLTAVVMFGVHLLQARRAGLLWPVAIIGVVVAGIKAPNLANLAVGVVEGDANGEGRIEIWRSYDYTFGLSPVFGLGPGTHGMGGVIEYHNAFVEIAAMSGMVGLIAFFALYGRILGSTLRYDLLLAGPVLAVLLYGVGGFSVRRLAFWGVLGIVAALARLPRPSTAEENPHLPTRHVSPRRG